MTLLSHADVFPLPAALPLECDDLLIAPTAAYETYGEPRPDAAILLLHGVAQSHRAAAETLVDAQEAYAPHGWFSGGLGHGKPLDCDSTWFISVGLLGSPWGSTSPISPHPEFGDAYGPDFPSVTATDMARAAAAVCRGLGVKRLVGAFGVGLGGMVALRLASLFPEFVGSVAALGTTASLPDAHRRRMASVRQMLDADRAYRHGYYEAESPPAAAVQRVRLAMLRELYPRDFLARRHGDLFEAERALEAEAASFARQFDANCYATLCEAHARADLYESLGRIKARTLLLTASTDTLAPPERARDTYHRLTAAGAPARYYELQSDAGHRAYDVESARVGQVLREFFGR